MKELYKALIFGIVSLSIALMIVIINDAISEYRVSFGLGVLAGAFAIVSIQLFGVVVRSAIESFFEKYEQEVEGG